MTRSDYQVTENFRGFIWSGQAIIGVDWSGWAIGFVCLRWYAGWYKEKG